MQKIDLSAVNTLQNSGLKATPQRVTILETIAKLGHANIDEIYRVAKRKHATMSLATVYKNITSLVENHLLKEVALNNFKAKYEIAKEAHAHLVCTKCGALEDVDITDSLIQSSQELVNTHHFSSDNIELNIYGTCRKCK